MVKNLIRAVWIAPLAALLGLLGGVGVYTFNYAQGLSYLSSDPAACANCHIMNDQYDSWRNGPHHAVAVCVDCNLPHDLAGKYFAKGLNGYHHSKAFTLQDFHEPIRIKKRNADILQENCKSCHADMVDDMMTMAGGDVKCVRCHERVGHGD